MYICICECVYMYMYMCMCVCICMGVYVSLSVYIYIYTYICVCVCVCVHLMSSIITIENVYHEQVQWHMVLLYSLITALSTGLGAIPFVCLRNLSQTWVAISNGVAAGMMVSARYIYIYIYVYTRI